MELDWHADRSDLPDLVRSGAVPQAALDTSVRRVLALKAMLGLFDDPFRRIDVKRETARSMQPTTRALARAAGRKAIVLLKNDGDLRPLPRAGKKIALIGPFASGAHDLVGAWVVYGDDAKAVDLAAGVRAAVTNSASVIVAESRLSLTSTVISAFVISLTKRTSTSSTVFPPGTPFASIKSEPLA